MDSIHYILKAEKILKKMGIEDFDLVPVPKEIHSNCGSAIQIHSSKKSKIIDILKEKGFSFRVFSYNPELNFFVEEEI